MNQMIIAILFELPKDGKTTGINCRLHIRKYLEHGRVCFFKALPDKGLVEKGKQAKGSKNLSKDSRLSFYNAAREKFEEPVVI